MDIHQYPSNIRPLSEDEGGGWLCEFPDLPGAMGDGETPQEALSDGLKALNSALIVRREQGRPIPVPGAFARASGNFALRMPKSTHARLTTRATAEGISLNSLINTILAESMGK